MKKLTLTIASFLLFFGISFSTYAADNNTDSHTLGIGITAHTLLNIASSNVTDGTSISLTPTPPTDAGNGIEFTSENTDLWLNYSVIKSSSDVTYAISAEITATTIPAGVTISVTAGNVTTSSAKGDLGATTGIQTLSTATSTPVITSIGSCHTGRGDSKGSNLTYTASVDESKYATLSDGNYQATITYTIDAE